MPTLHDLRSLFSFRRHLRSGPVAIELNGDDARPATNGTAHQHDVAALRALSTAAINGSPAGSPEAGSPESDDETPVPLDHERLHSLLNLLRNYLTADSRRSKRAIVLLEKLPKLLSPLNAVQQQQLRLAASLEEGLQQFRQRDRAMHETMQRLHESSRQQTEVLGLTQQQFDLHRTHVKHLAEALNAFHTSIDAIAASNRHSARAMEETMKASARQQRDLILGLVNIRRWLLTCVCISAGAAVLSAIALIVFVLTNSYEY